jgi:pyruvate ferredoxin oxidoreductase gamma subunit
MIRVRVHGRGGEGAVTLAHLIGASATYDGRFGQSCMGAAFERRGAPVEAFARIDDRRVGERGNIANPDLVVVLNPQLVRSVNVEAGMSPDGRIVVNSPEDVSLQHEVTRIDATALAVSILKRPIVNTVMLGAFAAATGLMSLGSLEEGTRLILSRFSKDKLATNLEAVRAGYEEVLSGKRVH